MWITTSGRARGDRGVDRVGVAHVGARPRHELLEPRQLVQRGRRRHAVAEAVHVGAELGEPEREPGPLEARVAGQQHAPALPEGGIDPHSRERSRRPAASPAPLPVPSGPRHDPADRRHDTASPRPCRPPTRVLGVPLALTDYAGALDWIDAAIAARSREYICVAATHTVVACGEDPELRAAVLGSSFTVPDGQPLVWALRALGNRIEDRVYGPDLMELACERAARTGARFFLYGGRDDAALALLERRLLERYPGLRIAGTLPHPFRELTADEQRRDRGADRRQRRRGRLGRDRRAAPGEVDGADARASSTRPCSIGVGAAFDFLSGARGSGAATAPAHGAGVGLPPDSRAAPALAALPAQQPPLRDRLRAPVRAAATPPRLSTPARAQPPRLRRRCSIVARMPSTSVVPAT